MNRERSGFNRGHCPDAIENAVEERQARRPRQASCRIDANGHRSLRIESGIDVEQFHQAPHQQSTGDRQDDDDGCPYRESESLHVRTAPIDRDAGMRPERIGRVSRPQLQHRDTAEHHRYGCADREHPNTAIASQTPTTPLIPTSTAFSIVNWPST